MHCSCFGTIFLLAKLPLSALSLIHSLPCAPLRICKRASVYSQPHAHYFPKSWTHPPSLTPKIQTLCVCVLACVYVLVGRRGEWGWGWGRQSVSKSTSSNFFTHAQTHTLKHTHTHTHTHPPTFTHSLTHSFAHTFIQSLTYPHAPTHSNIHVHSHTCDALSHTHHPFPPFSLCCQGSVKPFEPMINGHLLSAAPPRQVEEVSRAIVCIWTMRGALSKWKFCGVVEYEERESTREKVVKQNYLALFRYYVCGAMEKFSSLSAFLTMWHA